MTVNRQLTHEQVGFINAQRSGHLGTADANGVPHVVPVCFALAENTAYIVIDQKPKRVPPERVKRVRNIQENPAATLSIDRYDDDWECLGWIALHGRAELVTSAEEHGEALRLLRDRYPQYRTMVLEKAPVIALRIQRANAWGNME